MDWLDFKDYPQAIRETADALMDISKELRKVVRAKEYREAFIERYEKLEGSNAEQRKADLKVKLHNDSEHSGLVLREDELRLTHDRLEADLNLLRGQSRVLELQREERIKFGTDDVAKSSSRPF